MLTILLRTVLVYVFLIASMRLMGKRQLGELEITELVTTLLISEIATLPIVDQNIPLVYAVIPLITLLTLEVVLSTILLKCPNLKKLTSSRPSILIRRGVLDQKELRCNRISLDELISEIRQAGFCALDEIDYAIVEQNGKLSVLPKRTAQPPTAKDTSLPVKESGILHVLIEDGRRNLYNIKMLGLTQEALERTLQELGLREEEVFLLGQNDLGEIYYVKKEVEQ